MSEWISVEEKDPPIDTNVLIGWVGCDYYEQDYMTCDEDLNYYWANHSDEPPTHFMLIPDLK